MTPTFSPWRVLAVWMTVAGILYVSHGLEVHDVPTAIVTGLILALIVGAVGGWMVNTK